ncbi:hypothetical protein KIN20_013584 [Parelaphostrongylus tenuis]|uniref:Uncharacterized protein n=1 Tax=Parelaphostrongylus tenuis TaxID=148309 RepID=A0AAD5MXS6_PARTN|nr:hypothetical protein KIN20_013584 [Parelaphostrongylus tenuis]
MADNIVRQLCVEFRKKRVFAAKAAETVVENANIHEKLQKSKFEKYLDVKSKIAREDIHQLEMEKEQQLLVDAEQEMTAAQQSASDAEKRVQMRVAEVKSKATALRRSELDSDRGQSMKDMYDDMIDQLSQLHTGSRHSHRNFLMNKRRMMEEQGVLEVFD